MIYREHTILNLKHIFTPLETIAPPRTNVSSIEDFYELAQIRHHTNHIFANVHSRSSVNKLFFDLDGEFHKVERDAFILQDRLISRGVREKDILKVWTTKKGLHLYAKIKPINGLYNSDIRSEVKENMRLFTHSITEGLKTIDKTVMSDLNRVSRVAGIERFDNGMTPVVVSSNEVLKDWIDKHKRWISLINQGSEIIKEWGSVNGEFFDLYEGITDEDVKRAGSYSYENIKLTKTALSSYEIADTTFVTTMSRREALPMLEPILKPVLRKHYDEFVGFKPSHNNRIVCVYLLLEAGYSVDLICRYISYLNWDNFNPIRTRNNILSLLNNKKLKMNYD